MGKKTMSYNFKGLYTNFKGRFYGKFALGDENIEAEYRRKKEKALADSESASMTPAQIRYKNQRNQLIWIFRKFTNKEYKEMEDIFFKYDFEMSRAQIGLICKDFGEPYAEEDNKKGKKEKKIK